MFLITFFIIYTNIVIRNIKKDVRIVPDLYSKFLGLPSDVNMEHFLFQYFMDEIIPEIDYPIILVDSLHSPFSWENLDIPKKEFENLEPDDQKKLSDLMKEMKADNSVIPLKFSKTDEKIYSYVYFGDSDTLKQIKLMPYVGMGLIFTFIILGIYGIVNIKRSERNILWVGLAKETAHQFGTPLSSLAGWLNVLSSKLGKQAKDKEIREILDHMDSDLDRLNKIASRFGKVGSIIKNQKCNLHNIIKETIEHFRLQYPISKISIRFESEIETNEIELDPDLIKWTLENIIKNSLDAMQMKEGVILIKAFNKKHKTFIHVGDQGVGMPKSMFKSIFHPGATSKKRGWGLGLSLAKRIVEDYHHGKIQVVESTVDKGTTIEIMLPEE